MSFEFSLIDVHCFAIAINKIHFILHGSSATNHQGGVVTDNPLRPAATLKCFIEILCANAVRLRYTAAVCILKSQKKYRQRCYHTHSQTRSYSRNNPLAVADVVGASERILLQLFMQNEINKINNNK